MTAPNPRPPTLTLSDGTLWHIGFSGHGATFCGINRQERRLTAVLHSTERAGLWCTECLQRAAGMKP